MTRRLIIFAVAVVAALSCAGRALAGPNGYVGQPGSYDIRSFGAKCDGSTDDATALNAAFVDVNAHGGGTLVVPARKTCMVGSDVLIRDNVSLACEVGGTIKATRGASFSQAMLTTFSSSPLQLTASNFKIEGCALDLNGKASPAVYTSGENILFRRNYVSDVATSSGRTWNLVTFGCSRNATPPYTSLCDVSDNRIECANKIGAKDTGLALAGSTDDAQAIRVDNNQITGCDIAGISASSRVYVVNNGVSVNGSSATGISLGSGATGSHVSGNLVTNATGGTVIDLGAQNTTAEGNHITSNGSSGYGIKLDANYTSALDNKITVKGSAGTAIRSYGNNVAITGNTYSLAASPSTTAVGIYIGDGSKAMGATVTGNVGSVVWNDQQTHVVIAAQQSTITGNYFRGGYYCVVPSQVPGEFGSASINATFSDNRCFSQGVTAAIVQTGWILHGNYLAWLGSASKCNSGANVGKPCQRNDDDPTTGCGSGASCGGAGCCVTGYVADSVVRVGDDRTYKAGVTHLNMTGNLIHTTAPVPGIRFALIGKTCLNGANKFKTCSADSTDPSTGCGKGASCPGCCVTSTDTGVQISANHLLMSFSTVTGAGVDFSTGIDANSAIHDVTIDGNTFDMPASGSNSLGIKCPSSNQSKLANIVVGINGYTGMAPRAGDTTKGRLDLNCTPAMVNDAMTSEVWLPAAGCDAASPRRRDSSAWTGSRGQCASASDA